jgi:hypothetical protein
MGALFYLALFAVIFFIIGLLFLIKTDWMVRFQIWGMKKFGEQNTFQASGL